MPPLSRSVRPHLRVSRHSRFIPCARKGNDAAWCYRQHRLEFKRALVALSQEPGASVARISREHGIDSNQVFSWRRLYEQGRLSVPALMRDDGLLPVVLAPTAPAPSNDTFNPKGIIVLELGEVRVRIEGQPCSPRFAVPNT